MKQIDCAKKRHDDCLDKLIHRLAKKPGVHFPEQKFYSVGSHIRGEMDLHLMTINSQGKQNHRYYEVKGKDTARAQRHAITQFKKARDAFPRYEFKFIYVTPTSVKRVRLK